MFFFFSFVLTTVRSLFIYRRFFASHSFTYRYGGDFGAGITGVDVPSDNNFCINGLVQPNRKVSPATNEVAKVYEPVIVKWNHYDKSKHVIRVEIFNRYSFLDLSHLELSISILGNGEPTGVKPVVKVPQCLPGASVMLEVPVKLEAVSAPATE